MPKFNTFFLPGTSLNFAERIIICFAASSHSRFIVSTLDILRKDEERQELMERYRKNFKDCSEMWKKAPKKFSSKQIPQKMKLDRVFNFFFIV